LAACCTDHSGTSGKSLCHRRSERGRPNEKRLNKGNPSSHWEDRSPCFQNRRIAVRLLLRGLFLRNKPRRAFLRHLPNLARAASTYSYPPDRSRGLIPLSLFPSCAQGHREGGSRLQSWNLPAGPQAEGDRGFESRSLQRGVGCELRSSQARPASRASLTSVDYDLSYISISPQPGDWSRSSTGHLKGAVVAADQHADGGVLRRGAV
jgi:hypothetical protein